MTLNSGNQIRFYESPYYGFSNFSSHAVEYKGELYYTAEHAYQAAKFDDHSVRVAIQKARSAYEAKAIARSHKSEQNLRWDEMKLSIMEQIVRCKVDQHEDVRATLLETGQMELVENSPIDTFWGCGTDGSGKNELGKILMKIRTEISLK